MARFTLDLTFTNSQPRWRAPLLRVGHQLAADTGAANVFIHDQRRDFDAGAEFENVLLEELNPSGDSARIFRYKNCGGVVSREIRARRARICSLVTT